MKYFLKWMISNAMNFLKAWWTPSIIVAKSSWVTLYKILFEQLIIASLQWILSYQVTSKTCGAEDVTAEEAYHQVKSIPLLPVQLDSIKCSTSILQQIYQKVPRSVNNELIKTYFCSTVINSLISHVSPGLICATFADGSRNWKACEKYIERLHLPGIKENSFIYDGLSKSLFLHVRAYSSGTETSIKFNIYRKDALQQSYDQARKISSLEPLMKSGQEKCCDGPILYPLYYRDADGSIEEGEGYGPRKEFFALVGQQLLKGMNGSISPFVYQKSCESFWPNSKYVDAAALKWIGFVLGCSFTSRCSLGVAIPELLFKYLLDDSYRPSLCDALTFNEEIYKSMLSIRSMSDEKYREVLQADYCDEKTEREEYVRVYLEERLYQPVQWQLKVLGEGFRSVITSEILDDTGATANNFYQIALGGEGKTMTSISAKFSK